MTDDNAEPTKDDFAAVASLLDDILTVEGEPVLVAPSAEQWYPTYKPEVSRLVDAVSAHHMVLPDFDWMNWQQEAEEFLDAGRIARASLVEVRQLLTLHVRMERFCDGHLAPVIRSGQMAAILRRLQALVADFGAVAP